MGSLIQNLRIALRVLRNAPGFTALAVVTLGLGIAANTTVFTWIDAMLLHPIPGVPDPGQLAAIEGRSPQGDPIACAHPDFRDFQSQMKLASGVIASHFTPFTIGREEDAQRVFGEVVSANFFAVLGVKPLIGRFFTPEEDRDAQGAYPLAVISERLWHSRYRADAGILGKTARINGHQLTIVGVAPRTFHGTMGGLSMDIWVPLSQITQMGAVNTWTAGDRGAKCIDVLARLKPGVTIAQARAEAQSIGSRIAAAYPKTDAGVSATVVPLWKTHVGAQSLLLDPLRILMGISVLVLLIACANVANLLLARSVTRQREFGIRIAMGAGRGRLMAQLGTEVLLLAAAGTLCGIWLSQWAGDALGYLLPKTDLPITALFEPLSGATNARVWLFAALACVAATVLSAVMPVLHSGRLEVNETLKEGGRGGMSGSRSHRARALLVVVEVALAAVALIGAGLFTRSFQNARAIHPGFDSHNVLIAHIYVGSAGYSRQQEQQFDRALAERMERAPGVEGATYSDWVPLWFGESPWQGVAVEGGGEQPDIKMCRMLTAPGYFRLMRIALLSGRDFTDLDDEGGGNAPGARKENPVIIVNQEFARRFFQGRDPVGRKVRVGGTWNTVVGMVKDFKQGSPSEAPRPYFYQPFRQGFGTGHNNFVYIRTKGDPNTVRAALRQAVASLDPAGDLYDAMPMADYTDASLYPNRVAASLMTALGILSMLLAAVGLYSVMAYAVNERTHEIGIRMALGARPSNVLAMVLRKGLAMTGAGLAAGIAGALVLARLVSSLLVGVGAADPLTFTGAALFLAFVAVVASYVPAHRATRLDPLAALRCE